MSETMIRLLAVLAGGLLGAFFFGGLWWTIGKGTTSPRPAAWFLGSFLLRTTVALGGFYFLAQGDWRRLLAGLLGFFLARLLVLRLTRGPREKVRPLVAGGGP